MIDSVTYTWYISYIRKIRKEGRLTCRSYIVLRNSVYEYICISYYKKKARDTSTFFEIPELSEFGVYTCVCQAPLWPDWWTGLHGVFAFAPWALVQPKCSSWVWAGLPLLQVGHKSTCWSCVQPSSPSIPHETQNTHVGAHSVPFSSKKPEIFYVFPRRGFHISGQKCGSSFAPFAYIPAEFVTICDPCMHGLGCRRFDSVRWKWKRALWIHGLTFWRVVFL